MNQRYVIDPQSARAAGIANTVKALVEDALRNPKPTLFEVGPYSPKRSSPQNSRLWVLHTLTAKHLSEKADMLKACLREQIMALGKPKELTNLLADYVHLSHPWTAEAVHEVIFKPRFVHPRRETSSTKLSKLEMRDAQEEYKAWMVEQGIEVTE